MSHLMADVINFYTDAYGATDKGFGCIFDNDWAYAMWEENFITKFKPSIEFLELYVMVVTIELWAERLSNRRVVIFCDNQSVVGMINKSSLPCYDCMNLIWKIVLTSLRHNVCFFAHYVNTKDNTLADALSRNRLDIFWKHAQASVNPIQTPLPSNMWPVSKFLLESKF